MRNQWKYLFKRGLMLLAGSCCLILLASCGQNGAEGAQGPPEEVKAQFSDTGMTAAGKFFPYDGTLEISLCGAELGTLDGFEKFTQAENLGLCSNGISDLAPLGLVKLRELNLESNRIHNLSYLKGLTGLNVLLLSENQISDLTPLAGLTHLIALSLNQNQVADLAPLSGLTLLSDLSLEKNQITDLSALAGMNKLKHLYLADNQVRDLSALKGMDSLQTLDLTGNPLEQAQVEALREALPKCEIQF